MSQREEFFSCHSNESNSSLDRKLAEMDHESLEERVLHFLQTSDPPPQLTPDNVLAIHNPRRRFSDFTPELLRHTKALLKHITSKGKICRQNSNIFETIPQSSPIYNKLFSPKKEKKQKPLLRKYHPLNVLFNSGPDLSHILKPETLAIMAESRQSSNYATHSLVDSLRHDATITEVRIRILIFTLCEWSVTPFGLLPAVFSSLLYAINEFFINGNKSYQLFDQLLLLEFSSGRIHNFSHTKFSLYCILQ